MFFYITREKINVFDYVKLFEDKEYDNFCRNLIIYKNDFNLFLYKIETTKCARISKRAENGSIFYFHNTKNNPYYTTNIKYLPILKNVALILFHYELGKFLFELYSKFCSYKSLMNIYHNIKNISYSYYYNQKIFFIHEELENIFDYNIENIKNDVKEFCLPPKIELIRLDMKDFKEFFMNNLNLNNFRNEFYFPF